MPDAPKDVLGPFDADDNATLGRLIRDHRLTPDELAACASAAAAK